jgi:hypothetical protein
VSRTHDIAAPSSAAPELVALDATRFEPDETAAEPDERSLRWRALRRVAHAVVRAHHDDAAFRELSRDEVQQLERRRVGPLNVLEDDEQWALRRKTPEELTEVPEQSRLQVGGVAARGARVGSQIERRKPTSELRLTAARHHSERGRIHCFERRHQRISEERVQDYRFPPERASDGRGPLDVLAHDRVGQAGLADTTFTGNEDRRGSSALGVVERSGQPG